MSERSLHPSTSTTIVDDRYAIARRRFLTFAGATALLVGGLALGEPRVLLETLKHAAAPPEALVMARTLGVCLLACGGLMVGARRAEPSRALRSILLAMGALQIAILPIDPSAYLAGTFGSLGSFVPNTVLHIGLAIGFAFFIYTLPPHTTSLPIMDGSLSQA